MENRTVLAIIIGAMIIIGLFVYTQYEYQDVPNNKFETAYQLDSKYPHGLWMYRNLIEETFCDKRVELVSLDSLSYRRNTSLIAVHQRDRFNSYKSEILEYVSNGNSALLSTESYFAFIHDSIYPFPGRLNSITSGDYDIFGSRDTSATLTYQSPPFPQQITDSITVNRIKYFYNTIVDPVIACNRNNGIAFQYEIEKGSIIYHSMPHLFTNTQLSTQPGINHFYHSISLISSDTILIYDPLTFRTDKDPPEDYLSYIFSQKSLKAAYFIALYGMLGFVVFNSKRVQRQIPVQYKNRNTLGEYIDTLTELNYSIGNHSNMIKVMRDIFFHTVYNKYYIEKTDPEFVTKFAKKSKIPKAQIEVILRRFEEAKSREFTTVQLTALYHRIQTIYQIIGN